MMKKRDLKADLELCNKATSDPWSTIDRLSKYVNNTGEVKSFTREQFIQSEQETICTTYKPKNKHNAEFIAEAREGWPHAIERAIKAEALVRELVDALRESRALITSLSLAHSCFDHAESIGKVMSMSTASLVKTKEVLDDARDT